MISICLLVLTIAIVSSNAQVDIPALPKDYGIVIEANIVFKNRTTHLSEFHSETLGFSRFHFTGHEASVIEIFDFNKQLRYEIYQPFGSDALNCSTVAIDAASRFGHQRNFTETFRFGGALDETYNGVAVVRGVVADHWTHRFVHAPGDGGRRNVSADFVQDFFWSREGREYNGHASNGPVPLQSIVKGSFNGSQFENHYTFGQYFEGVPPTWARNFLFGDCAVQETIARLDADHLHHHGELHPDDVPKLPPMPRDFSLVVEGNIRHKNRTVHLKEWHSESLGQSRIHFEHAGTHIIEIFDFHNSVRHEIVQIDAHAEVNCSTVPIDAESRFDHQRNFSEIFHFGGAFEEQYNGRRLVRGIWCDHWTHHFKSGEGEPFSARFADIEYDFTQDFYFSVNGWWFDGAQSSPVPVRSIVAGSMNGTEFHNIYNFGLFESANPPLFEHAFLFGDCNVQRVIGQGTAVDCDGWDLLSSRGMAPFAIWFIGLLIGLGVGVLVMLCYNKRKGVQMA